MRACIYGYNTPMSIFVAILYKSKAKPTVSKHSERLLAVVEKAIATHQGQQQTAAGEVSWGPGPPLLYSSFGAYNATVVKNELNNFWIERKEEKTSRNQQKKNIYSKTDVGKGLPVYLLWSLFLLYHTHELY